MSFTNSVTSAALTGRNVAIVTTPGIGTVNRTLKALKEAELNVAYFSLAVMSLIDFSLPVVVNGELKISYPESMTEAEVIVLDDVGSFSQEISEMMSGLMIDRKIGGATLHKLKSVVVILGKGSELDEWIKEAPFPSTTVLLQASNASS